MKKLLSGIAVWIGLLGLAPADTFTVTNLNDSGPGSLRAALLAANGSAGADEITFTGLAGTITLASSLPTITDDVTIIGAGASLLTVSGGNAVRLVTIEAGKTVQMSGLTLANGMATNYANGAAIENHGTLTVIRCVFSNNRTVGGFGGAIFNDGVLTLISTTCANNRVTGGASTAPGTNGGSGGGGGGFGGAVYSAASTITITGCIFTANLAIGGTGSLSPEGAPVGTGGTGGGPNGGAGGAVGISGEMGGFGSGGGGGGGASSPGGYNGGAGGAGGFGGGGGGGGGEQGNLGTGSRNRSPGSGGFGGGVGASGGFSGGNRGGGGAGFGSALFLASGSGSITSCTFNQNTATGGVGGGGWFDTGSIAGQGGAGMGSLFVHAGNFLVEDCTFSGNLAYGGVGGSAGGRAGSGATAGGAAITNYGGILQMSRSTIAANQATGGNAGEPGRDGGAGGAATGAGVACVGVGGSTSVINVTISGNSATGGDSQAGSLGGGSGGSASGGALAVTGGSAALINCTIALNRVQPGLNYPSNTGGPNATPGSATGGGIYASSVSPSLSNNLFSGNLRRVVIRDKNHALVSTTDTPSDGSGAMNSLGHNLFTTNVGVTGLIASDLRNVSGPLGPLQDNGGPTQTHALPFGSPAINAGENAVAPATDQRGFARPQGSGVDIGAYEVASLSVLADGFAVASGSLIRDAAVSFSFEATFPTGAILYTLDGSTPTFSSTLYTGPFTLTNSATIRVVAYSSDFTSSVFAGPLNFIRAIPRTLTVTTSGPGSVEVDPPNTGPYPDGAVVTLTATPAAGYMFQGWSGALSGNTSPAILTMSANRAVQATFVAIVNYTLSVTSNGQGTVTLSPPGGTYQANSIVTLTITPAAGWLFQGWSGDLSGSASQTTLAMASNRSVTATFVAIPTYTLSFVKTGQGMVTLDPPGGTYLTGTLVTLTEEPASGWIFSGWGGDANGSASQVQITMNANKNVQATFTAIFSLTVTTLGGGAIGVTPPTGPYTTGTVVSVVSAPASGWQFVSWLGDLENSIAANDITMSRNKSIEAVFGTTLQTNVIGSGAVNRQPNLPLFPMRSSVRLSAIPAGGSYFSFWSNPINSTANSVDFSIVNAMPSVFAVFAPLAENESAFNVLTDGGGTVAASPTGAHFTNGTTVQLLAKPAAGQAFLGWSGDASGGNPAINVFVDSSKTVTAHFTKRPAVAITADGELLRSEGARLVIRGEAGSNYKIVAAQTLTGQFIFIGDVTNVFGTVQFRDPNATALDQRFYRVIVAP